MQKLADGLARSCRRAIDAQTDLPQHARVSADFRAG
jgi:hypothetical protein